MAEKLVKNKNFGYASLIRKDKRINFAESRNWGLPKGLGDDAHFTAQKTVQKLIKN